MSRVGGDRPLMKRRAVLRASAALAMSACSDARPRRAPASGKAPWTPASLAPASVDPAAPPAIAVIAMGADATPLVRGFALREPVFAADTAPTTPETLAASMRAAVKTGARLLVVSGDARTAAQVASEVRVAVLFLDATDATVHGAGEWVFFTCASDEKLGRAAVQLVEKRKASRVTVIAADTASGRSAAAGFRAGLLASSLAPPLYESRVGTDEAPFVRELKSALSLRADLVFAPVDRTMLGVLVAEAKRIGMSGAGIVALDGAAALTPSSIEGVSFVAHHHVAIDNPANTEFVRAFRERHKNDPTVLDAIGYEAATLARSALTNAKDESREAVRDALAGSGPMSLLTGDATFDNRGNPDRAVALCRVDGGRVVLEGLASC